jgi:cytochrome c biogenesis protein CcmG/thiol:disulfide interchange protein DsbE
LRRYSAALAAALLLAACSTPERAGASHLKAEAVRKPAPNFSLKDADGRIVQLSDFRGKVVLLNFWATWCDPCRIEIPWFVEFERQHKGQGFAVVGVSMDEDGWQAVKPFISETGINYRILLGDDKIAELYGGIDSLPTSFVIDREGRIAAVHVGLVSKSRYENDLQQLFQTPAKTAGAGARRLRGDSRRAG